MYWSIKQIKVEEKDKDDPSKFDKIIHAIKSNVSLPGFSNVLWTVRHQTLIWMNFQDPKKQQWKSKKSIKWDLHHSITNGLIQLKMFEDKEEVVDAQIKVRSLMIF